MKHQWGVTEDDIGRTHVLPVYKTTGFKTKREAKAFAERIEDEEEKIFFSDEDSDVTTSVSLGHSLSINCTCHPEQKQGQIVHNVIQ